MKYTVFSQESCNPTILEAIKNANALANGVQASRIFETDLLNLF